MQIARIKYDSGRISNAIVEKDKVRIIENDIFSSPKYSGEELDIKDVEFLAPVDPYQIIAVGLNYTQHARETSKPSPKEPQLFIKGRNAVTGPNDNIILPEAAPNEVDFEAELAIIIGREAKSINPDAVSDYILGYTCANDISARDCQKRRDIQWARGKSFDTFAPIGPWIATDIDADNLNISLTLNNKIMQKSNTSDMIFSTKELVSFISKAMTLYPGTLIFSGTPSGVGFARDPQIFLRDGDRISVKIQHIGTLENRVISSKNAEKES